MGFLCKGHFLVAACFQQPAESKSPRNVIKVHAEPQSTELRVLDSKILRPERKTNPGLERRLKEDIGGINYTLFKCLGSQPLSQTKKLCSASPIVLNLAISVYLLSQAQAALLTGKRSEPLDRAFLVNCICENSSIQEWCRICHTSCTCQIPSRICLWYPRQKEYLCDFLVLH